MTYDLTQDEVNALLNLVAIEGMRAAAGGHDARHAFAHKYQPIIEKLDPKGWAEAEQEIAQNPGAYNAH